MSRKRRLDLSEESDRVIALQWLDESDEGENVIETDSECSESEDNVETQDIDPEIFEVYYFYMYFIEILHNIYLVFRPMPKKIMKLMMMILYMYRKMDRSGAKKHLDLHERKRKI